MSSLFTIKKLSVVSSWMWDVQTTDCAICKNEITEQCNGCKNEGKIEDCTIATGTCGHSFHLHCIELWIKRSPKCPMDNQPWEYQNLSLTH